MMIINQNWQTIMKKILLFLAIVSLSTAFISCEKEVKDPVLDMGKTQNPAILSPANNSTFVLTEAEADNDFTLFEWSATVYSLDNLANTKYILQMDVNSNAFESPVTLQSAEATSFGITVGGLNQKLMGAGLEPAVAADVYFRVVSFINDQNGYEAATSEVLSLNLTPYTDVVIIKPIYLLGDATDPGWDNANALPLTHVEGSVFSIVANLQADKYLKFISVLGQWTPQWGTDENGTSSGGNLVYRPTEDVPDPAGIPSPSVAGEYLITVDTAALTYTIGQPNPELFLLGDGSPAGWDNAAATPLNGTSGNYSITIDLPGGGFLKFITTLGQWAPQYGTDETGTATGGPLVYRPTEDIPDPAGIPAPAAAGTYTITVNTNDLTYTIE
ncbi:SusE domain-containing protein [Klebsiella pneumoniae]